MYNRYPAPDLSTLSSSQNRPLTPTEQIAKNSVWSVIDTTIGLASGFISSILVARALGPDILGYYAYAVFVSNSIGVIVTAGIGVALRRFLAGALGRGAFFEVRALLREVLWLQLLISAVLMCAGFGIIYTVVPPEHRMYSVLIVLSVPPNMLLAIPTSANVAAEDFAPNVWSSMVSTIVSLVAVLIVLFFGWGLVGLASALLLSRIVDLAVRAFLYRVRFRRRLLAGMPAGSHASRYSVPPDVRRRLWRFCAQSSTLQLLNVFVWDRSEMLFLERFSSVRQLSFYSTAFNVTQQMIVAPRMFAGAAVANMMVRAEADPAGALGVALTMTRYMALVSFPISFGLAALSGPAIQILYGSRYLPAIPTLAVLAGFTFARALYIPVQHLLTTTDMQGPLIRWTIIAAVAKVALDLLLIAQYGAAGGAVALSATQVAAAAAVWYVAQRRLNFRVPAGELMKIAGCAAVMALPCLLIALLLPALPALLTAVPLGTALYGLMLRQTRCLTALDRARFVQLTKRVPGRLRGIYAWAIDFLVPADPLPDSLARRG